MREPTQDEWRRIVATALADGGYIDLFESDGAEYLEGERDTFGAEGVEAAADQIAAAFRKVMEV